MTGGLVGNHYELAELPKRIEAGGPTSSFEDLAAIFRRLTDSHQHTLAEILLRESRNSRYVR